MTTGPADPFDDPLRSLDMPFEEDPRGGMAIDAEAYICGGVVVKAATARVEVPGADGGEPVPAVWPVVAFRFSLTDGTVLPDIALMMPPDQMRKLRPLFSQAATLAAQKAEQGYYPPAAES